MTDSGLVDVERLFACSVSDMAPGSSRAVQGSTARIALFRNAAGEFFATADSCTHEQFSLGEDGDLDGTVLTCPLHLAQYDVRTGAPTCLPATVRLRTYGVEIDADGGVFIVVPAPG